MKNVKMFISLKNDNLVGIHNYDHDTKHMEHNFYTCSINENDYSNIYKDHEVTFEEFEDAINVIITHFMNHELEYVMVDLDERNRILAPTKEMTLEDIEKELGYKVKIINKGE